MFDLVEPPAADPFGTVDDRLAWLLTEPPSAVTLAVLESLTELALTARQKVLVAKAWDRQVSAVVVAAMDAKLTAVTTSLDGGEAADTRDAELALALRRTDLEMNLELRDARRLAALPVLRALLRHGETTLRHLSVLAHLTRDLHPADAAEVDAAVSARAASMTASGFRRVVRRVIAQLDKRTPEQRARARKQQIGVTVWPQDDGLVTVGITMPATDGIAALNALNADADRLRTRDDPRSHGERQVKALLAALGVCGDDTTVASQPRARRRSEVQVVIDWRDLLGLRDHPAELLGYGPIPADDVRRLLTEEGSVLRRLVTDPVSGVVVDYGRTRHIPDETLRRLLAARDVTCRYPGCTRNAIWCDDEHCLPYDTGGPTSTANCCLMCRHHHRRKTFDGYTYTRPDPATGETRWRTPLGFTYTQHPAHYRDGGPDPGDTTTGDNDPP
jgi:hypothetical protein